jgi:hypothetical protein
LAFNNSFQSSTNINNNILPALAFLNISPIFNNINNKSINNKLFISNSTKLSCNYGDCSSMVECAVVVRVTRVRFPPFAFISLQSNDYISKGNLTREQGSITSKAVLLEFPKNQRFFENPPFAYFLKNSLVLGGSK